MSSNKMPYSYHTFLLPFLWNSSGEIKALDSLEKILLSNCCLRWAREKKDPHRTADAVYYAQTQ